MGTSDNTPTPDAPRSGADIMRQFLPASPYVRHLGLRLTDLQSGVATLTLPFTEPLATIGTTVPWRGHRLADRHGRDGGSRFDEAPTKQRKRARARPLRWRERPRSQDFSQTLHHYPTCAARRSMLWVQPVTFVIPTS